jgi:cyclic pyranopterin phosphate synthase
MDTETPSRPINYLRVSITDRCNLRCVYCMPKEGVPRLEHQEVLTYEEILKLVQVFTGLGIQKVRVTGGEPLVRKGVLDFLKALKEIPGIRDISLTTNGVLLGPYARPLFALGIRRINISLDSLDPVRYAQITRKNMFPLTWEGIQEAERAGFDPIKINCVPVGGLNFQEIEAFARLSLTKPYHIRFIEFMPVGEGNGWSAEKVVPSEEILKRIRSLGELIPVKEDKWDGPARRYRFNGAPGEIGIISPLTRHFCGTCNRLRLTSDGKLRTCLFAREEIDLKTPLSEGAGPGELEDLVRGAIRRKKAEGQQKPAGGFYRKCQRGMSQIGG